MKKNEQNSSQPYLGQRKPAQNKASQIGWEIFVISTIGEIIQSSDGPRHLSTILLKNFYLFKIAESVISFYLKKKKKF